MSRTVFFWPVALAAGPLARQGLAPDRESAGPAGYEIVRIVLEGEHNPVNHWLVP